MNKNSKFNKTYNAQQSLDVSYLWKHPLNICNSNGYQSLKTPFDTSKVIVPIPAKISFSV
jgi:hypothetical protein